MNISGFKSSRQQEKTLNFCIYFCSISYFCKFIYLNGAMYVQETVPHFNSFGRYNHRLFQQITCFHLYFKKSITKKNVLKNIQNKVIDLFNWQRLE